MCINVGLQSLHLHMHAMNVHASPVCTLDQIWSLFKNLMDV